MSDNCTSQMLSIWRGIAFEELCLNHIQNIKKALEVGGVASAEHSCIISGEGSGDGTQIDLMIDRADNVINLCEMKFYGDEFRVTKEYHKKLAHRISLLSEKIPKRKVIHLTLVTTEGLSRNEYSSIFQKVVTLEELLNG